MLKWMSVSANIQCLLTSRLAWSLKHAHNVCEPPISGEHILQAGQRSANPTNSDKPLKGTQRTDNNYHPLLLC